MQVKFVPSVMIYFLDFKLFYMSRRVVYCLVKNGTVIRIYVRPHMIVTQRIPLGHVIRTEFYSLVVLCWV